MLLAQVLARLLGEGQLTIIDDVGRPHRIEGARPGPSVTLRVHTWWTGVRLALRPRLALGEAYMDGTLTVEDGGDIYDLLDLLGSNIAALEATPMVRWSYTLQRWLRVLEQYNPIGKAQRNVAHHYDLNGQLYDFFLDRDRQYSCAYFKTGDEPLEQAQLDKKRHIAAKLLLRPGQRVLDIGSGWGGMGLFLSQQFGVDVTGVTLSKEQHAVSSRRALEDGPGRPGALQAARLSPGSRHVRPHRLGRHVRACRRRPLHRVLHQGEGAPGRRRRDAAALDRPHGAARAPPTPGCANTSSPAAIRRPCRRS